MTMTCFSEIRIIFLKRSTFPGWTKPPHSPWRILALKPFGKVNNRYDIEVPKITMNGIDAEEGPEGIILRW